MSKVVVCAIAKNEHLYIKDWVEWYVNLGIDTIYLFDNDNVYEKKDIRDFIPKEYLDNRKVVVINVRGKEEKCYQQHLYNDFYDKNKFTFDWCLFVDIDEYLTGVKNIEEVVKNVPYYVNQVRIKWKLFGDNDLITRDMNKPVYEVFTKEVNSSLNRNLKEKGNLECQGKFMIRGKLKNIKIPSPHYAIYGKKGLSISMPIPSCFPSGKICPTSKVAINGDYSKEKVFINHYMTKSLEEFVNQKLKRNDCVYNKDITLDYYWRINKKTTEKLVWLNDKGLL